VLPLAVQFAFGVLHKEKESVVAMKQKRLLDQVGLRLSRQALRVLKERGIFAHSPVSLEHQHLAKRMSCVGWSLAVRSETWGDTSPSHKKMARQSSVCIR